MATIYLTPFVLRSNAYGSAATALLVLPFIIGGIIGTPIIGHLADRFGARKTLFGAIALGAVALGFLALLGPQPIVLVACLFGIGCLANGGAAVLTSVTADVARQFAGIGTGSALGSLRLAQSVGLFLGPAVAGYAYLCYGATLSEIGIPSSCWRHVFFFGLSLIASSAPTPNEAPDCPFDGRYFGSQ